MCGQDQEKEKNWTKDIQQKIGIFTRNIRNNQEELHSIEFTLPGKLYADEINILSGTRQCQTQIVMISVGIPYAKLLISHVCVCMYVFF